jgi:hypothetical protein
MLVCGTSARTGHAPEYTPVEGGDCGGASA